VTPPPVAVTVTE